MSCHSLREITPRVSDCQQHTVKTIVFPFILIVILDGQGTLHFLMELYLYKKCFRSCDVEEGELPCLIQLLEAAMNFDGCCFMACLASDVNCLIQSSRQMLSGN